MAETTDAQSATNELRDSMKRVDAFMVELKNEKIRAAQEKAEAEAKAKAKEQADGWIKYAALAMLFITLTAGYCATRGGSCSGKASKELSEATYNQTKAGDQWSFFQSKSLKLALAESETNIRECFPNPDPNALKTLREKVKRYEKEREEIKAQAEAYEKTRDELRADAEIQTVKSAKFSRASQAFTLTLAVGALCLLLRKKPMVLAVVVGAAYSVVLMVLALRA